MSKHGTTCREVDCSLRASGSGGPQLPKHAASAGRLHGKRRWTKKLPAEQRELSSVRDAASAVMCVLAVKTGVTQPQCWKQWAELQEGQAGMVFCTDVDPRKWEGLQKQHYSFFRARMLPVETASHWVGFGIMQHEMQMLSTALRWYPNVTLMSGDSIPVKCPQCIPTFDITGVDAPPQPDSKQQRIGDYCGPLWSGVQWCHVTRQTAGFMREG